MRALLHLADASAGNGTTLLGIAAVLAALTPLGVATLNRRRRPGTSDQDEERDELADAALERIKLLKEDRADLQASLERCQSERRVLAAEGKLAATHIGHLEERLARTRAELHEAESKLERGEFP